MPDNKYGIVSKTVFFFFGIFYLLDILMSGQLSGLFLLDPSLVIDKGEYWRLLTYPLAFDSIGSFFIFAIAMSIFAPKIEELYASFTIPVVTALLIALHGIVLTLINLYTGFAIKGTDGISYFIFASFLLAAPGSRVVIPKFKTYKSVQVISFISLIWLFIGLGKILIDDDYSFMINAELGAFGIINGLLLHYQLKFFKKFKSEYEEVPYHAPDDEPELISVDEFRRMSENSKGHDDKYVLSKNKYSNEERMNEILDKISAQGMDSLSPYEHLFLEEYSKNL